MYSKRDEWLYYSGCVLTGQDVTTAGLLACLKEYRKEIGSHKVHPYIRNLLYFTAGLKIIPLQSCNVNVLFRFFN